MSLQRTLCIIKPDAVERGLSGRILTRVLEEGFRPLAMRQLQLTRQQAEGFYAVHRGRPFFADLCTLMSRSPVVVVALERDNAVAYWREVIGATDPTQASDGSIRKLYGASKSENAVHGSDSEENGLAECSYFFAGIDLL